MLQSEMSVPLQMPCPQTTAKNLIQMQICCQNPDFALRLSEKCSLELALDDEVPGSLFAAGVKTHSGVVSEDDMNLMLTTDHRQSGRLKTSLISLHFPDQYFVCLTSTFAALLIFYKTGAGSAVIGRQRAEAKDQDI